MKKFVSSFVAVVMVVTMVFAFSALASAASVELLVSGAFFETYFGTNESGTFTEVSFTVQTAGYYIIQSFGFFDEQYNPVETEVYVELYSSDQAVGEDVSSSGYNQGFFINEYLEANETYRLYVWFSESVYFGRLSIVNAANYFVNENRTYLTIEPLYVSWGGSSQAQYSFTDDEQNAVVFLVNYLEDSTVPVRIMLFMHPAAVAHSIG